MYQENELQQLYKRLKAQYPRYDLEFSGDCLTLNRLHSKIEVNRDGAKLYINGNLYDQFTSADVDDSDDLYELIEASDEAADYQCEGYYQDFRGWVILK